MTRLEHSAIVREDHSLLQEGVKEFFSKAKKWFQWAGQEFLRYLDKVIDTWTNIQNKIRTMLVNVEDLKKKVNNKLNNIVIKTTDVHTIKIGMEIAQKSDNIKKYVDKCVDEAEKEAATSDGNYKKIDMKSAGNMIGNNKYDDEDFGRLMGIEVFDLKDNIVSFSDRPVNSTYHKTVHLTGDFLTKAINFAKDGRVKCIKTLQYARNAFAKLINMGIRSADAEKEDVKAIKKVSSKVRETLNKWISIINKATNAVIAAINHPASEKEAEQYRH